MCKRSKLSLTIVLCTIIGSSVVACDQEKTACQPGIEYLKNNKCEACRTGTHVNQTEDGCDVNSNSDCGFEHIDCDNIENAASAECDRIAGVCKIKCKDGYLESKGQCIPDETKQCREDTDCPKDVHAESIKCKQNKCIITCEEQYHLNNSNVCVENVYTTCENTQDCREQIERFTDGACNVGTCIVLSCQTGYHPSQDNASCESDADNACGTNKKNCLEIENAVEAECKAGKCIVNECRAGYRVEESGSACELDSSCTTASECIGIEHADDVACKSGKCVPLSCETGFHVNQSGSMCEEDSDEACGKYRQDCNNIDNVTSASCVDTKCIINACKIGYHPASDQLSCEADSIYICGNEQVRCTDIPYSVNHQCVGGICEYGCKDGAVREYDNACTITTCDTHYHHLPNKTDCEPDTDKSCGEDRINCMAIANASSQSCENGVCDYVCNSDKTIISPLNTCMDCVDGFTVNAYDDTQNNTTCIKGSLSIKINNPITVDFPQLVAIEQDLSISNNYYGQSTLSMNKLQSVRQLSYFDQNSDGKQTILKLNALKYGSIIISHYYSNATDDISFINLRNGALSITKSSLIKSVNLPSLKNASYIFFSNVKTDETSQINFSSLETTGSISIQDSQIHSMSFPKLEFAKGVRVYSSNANLVFPILTKTGSFEVEGITFSAPMLKYGAVVIKKTTGELDSIIPSFKGNLAIYSPNGDSIISTAITQLSSLSIQNESEDSSVTSISFPNLESATIKRIDGFAKLTSINMPKLKSTGDGQITITNCPLLTKENCNLGENECIIQ